MEERKRCTRCCVLLPVSHFNVKRSGDYYKICAHCTDVKKAYMNRMKISIANRINNNNTDILLINNPVLSLNI